ncbi:hypothetical protein GH714_037847 [Hevea brasiliensis]|uniref:RHOMBOID-like protein n=1 Tax=Hevea brasiliensis TaxID=3981 RepID=A0A6A6LPZ4_HEVBR|nr:hypothetical protein GH714_037847 [Hevea brasiliensis]
MGKRPPSPDIEKSSYVKHPPPPPFTPPPPEQWCSWVVPLIFAANITMLFTLLRIGVLYVLSGFGGSLMSALSPKPNISVGASGALLGLLGSMLSELFLNWTIYANKCKSVSTLLLIITLNLAFGLIPHVDNSAHIGGFLSGFLLGFILLMRPQYGYVPVGLDIAV